MTVEPEILSAVFALALAICAICVMLRRQILSMTASRDDLSAVQSSHKVPTPRVGGVGIFAALALGGLFLPQLRGADFIFLMVSTLPVFLAGLAEDLGLDVSPRYRLLAAMASSALAILLFGAWVGRADVPGLDLILTIAPIAILFTVFATAGVANAFNLIDGMNGLAAGTAVLTALGLGAVAYILGDAQIALFCAAMVAACLGFLVFNFPLGKLFLGDAGAYSIGHILAWVAVLLMARFDALATWSVLLIFFWPIADTMFAIYRRASAGLPTDQPDRLHYHQFVMRSLEIMLLGRSRRGLANPLTTVILMPLIAAPVICGVLFWNAPLVAFALLLCFAVFFVTSYRVGMLFARANRGAASDAVAAGLKPLGRGSVKSSEKAAA